ncbi:hypothetical protein CKW48_21600, partial [Bordetella pertussis]
AGDAQVLITSAARVRIDGVGELEILPGGRDLPALLDELRAASAGDAQVLITSAARVRIDGVGELEILPGGRDLPA